MCCAGVRMCSAIGVHRAYHLYVSRAQSNRLTCFGTSEFVRSPDMWSWLASPSPVEDSSVAPVGLTRAALILVAAVMVLSVYM